MAKMYPPTLSGIHQVGHAGNNCERVAETGRVAWLAKWRASPTGIAADPKNNKIAPVLSRTDPVLTIRTGSLKNHRKTV